jgi:hypothetical protein
MNVTGKTVFKHCQKRLRVKSIKTTVNSEDNNTDDCRLTSKHLNTLKLS